MSSDWRQVTIGDVTKVVTKGTTPTSIGGRFTENGIPFVKVETLSEWGGFLSDKFAFIDKETDGLLKRSRIQANDVLLKIKSLLKRYKYPPDQQASAVETVLQQAETLGEELVELV